MCTLPSTIANAYLSMGDKVNAKYYFQEVVNHGSTEQGIIDEINQLSQ